MSVFFETWRSKYHDMVFWMASLKSHAGYQPSSAPAFSIESESRVASCTLFGSEPSTHSPGQILRISSTRRFTGCRALGSGPKLNGVQNFEPLPSLLTRAPSHKYPLKHSK